MPKFSALVYVSTNPGVLHRALESLTIADDVLVINAELDPTIRKIALEHGARIKKGIPGVTPGAYLMDAFYPWLLVIRPFESLDADLMRSIEEWSRKKRDDNPGYAFEVLEQHNGGWNARPPELRLVNKKQINWIGDLPPNATAPLLAGHLLRFRQKDAELKAA